MVAAGWFNKFGSRSKLKKGLCNFVLGEKSQTLERSGRVCAKSLFAALLYRETDLDNSVLNLADSGILLSTTGLTAERDVMKRLHLGWM